MSMENIVAVGTAAANGIGLEIARKFAREGATVVISDMDESVLQSTVEKMNAAGGKVRGVLCDMSRPEQIDGFFKEVLDEYGHVDVLVNNVGIAGPTKPIENITLEEWDTVMAVNVRAAFQSIKCVVPAMRRQGGGKIVNMSSMSGKRPLPNRTPYCAAKMAIIGLTRTLAAELGPDNILVNAVCPGSVAGERIERVVAGQAKLEGRSMEDVRNEYLAPSPLHRFVPPEQVADAVYFLVRKENTTITGEDFNITAGVCMF